MANKLRSLLLAATALSFSMCAYAEEAPAPAESPLTVDTSVAIFNQYMFRGLRLYDGLSTQPSITASYDTGYGTVSANLWMHLSSETRHNSQRFTELDETLKYSNTFGPATVSVGNVWYTYSDYGDGTNIEDSAEVFGSVALDLPLSPVLSVYNDWKLLHAQYYELGFSHEFTGLDSSESTLVPFLAIGFGSNADKVYADDGLEQVTTGANLNLKVSDFSVVPGINYSFKVDDKTVNQLWFGLTVGYSL